MARNHFNSNVFNLNSMNITEEQPDKKHQRLFKLHDSETVCKLFLEVCKQYDLGNVSPEEVAEKCMRIYDEAENFGLMDSLKTWES